MLMVSLQLASNLEPSPPSLRSCKSHQKLLKTTPRLTNLRCGAGVTLAIQRRSQPNFLCRRVEARCAPSCVQRARPEERRTLPGHKGSTAGYAASSPQTPHHHHPGPPTPTPLPTHMPRCSRGSVALLARAANAQPRHRYRHAGPAPIAPPRKEGKGKGGKRPQISSSNNNANTHRPSKSFKAATRRATGWAAPARPRQLPAPPLSPPAPAPAAATRPTPGSVRALRVLSSPLLQHMLRSPLWRDFPPGPHSRWLPPKEGLFPRSDVGSDMAPRGDDGSQLREESRAPPPCPLFVLLQDAEPFLLYCKLYLGFPFFSWK